MPALAVLDEVVEIELLGALALAALTFRLSRFAFRLFCFHRIKLGNNLVEQRIIVGKFGCSLGKCVAGDADEPFAVTISFDGHSVSAWDCLLAMDLRAVALADDAQTGATRRNLDIGTCTRDEIARRRLHLAGRGIATISEIKRDEVGAEQADDDAVAAPGFISSQRSGEIAPSRRFFRACKPTRMTRLIRYLSRLAVLASSPPPQRPAHLLGVRRQRGWQSAKRFHGENVPPKRP